MRDVGLPASPEGKVLNDEKGENACVLVRLRMVEEGELT